MSSTGGLIKGGGGREGWGIVDSRPQQTRLTINIRVTLELAIAAAATTKTRLCEWLVSSTGGLILRWGGGGDWG